MQTICPHILRAAVGREGVWAGTMMVGGQGGAICAGGNNRADPHVRVDLRALFEEGRAGGRAAQENVGDVLVEN